MFPPHLHLAKLDVMKIGQPQAFHEVLVITPLRFDQGAEAVLAVREQRIVVLNLTAMEPSLAQRTADFVSGGVRALDGQEHRVGDQVLLFAPANVDVNLS
ncbi:hypothetical protein WH7805_03702 [Synechococcus sp. WH 7805]|nr:hypothetical protein WH7805_03702 [Synechococcus sp. WH 7805]